MSKTNRQRTHSHFPSFFLFFFPANISDCMLFSFRVLMFTVIIVCQKFLCIFSTHTALVTRSLIFHLIIFIYFCSPFLLHLNFSLQFFSLALLRREILKFFFHIFCVSLTPSLSFSPNCFPFLLQ